MSYPEPTGKEKKDWLTKLIIGVALLMIILAILHELGMVVWQLFERLTT